MQRLYQERILPETKNPYHFAKKEKADWIIKAYNPLCGDKYDLYVNQQVDQLKEVHFHGIGCALSKASTSLLLKKIEGKSRKEVEQLCQSFIEMVTDENRLPKLADQELELLAELRNFEGRTDCITLSWMSLLNYLTEESHGS